MIAAASPSRTEPRTYISYSPEIEAEISQLIGMIVAASPGLAATYHPRWLAIQLLERDASLLAQVRAAQGGAAVEQAVASSLARLQGHYGEDIDVALADYRYSFVHDLVGRVVTRPPVKQRHLSDRVDRIMTHRYLGIPIFLVIMWIVFKITTDLATPYLDWIDSVIAGPITNWVVSLLGVVGLGGTWVESLFVDGIIAGVGGVLVFVPVLMSLYLALAILEDSGYMARAAFVMDRLMSLLGLHGKSFLPLIVGFGCTVPALYATRTLEHRRDRILTGLLVPFMSCGARLPVYMLFATIFFARYAGLVIFSLYLIGILTAITLGIILRRTLFKREESVSLLMEFPPYRLPTAKNIWHYVWERTSAFIRNAWTVILMASVVIWFLMATPTSRDGSFAETDVDDSAFATIAGAIAPVFAPLGFGSWESAGALITGLVAKEVVISTMAQVYRVAETEATVEPTSFFQEVGQIVTGFIRATIDTLKSIPLIVGINLFDEEPEADQTNLMAAVRHGFESSSGGHGVLAAFAFMVFVLLYTPCVASLVAERHELGSKWMWFSLTGQFALAWMAALVVFQGGKLLGVG